MAIDPEKEELVKRFEIVLGLRRMPIPPRFQMNFGEGLFSECSYCRRPLFSEESQYLIAKYYVGTDLVQEIAICAACSQELKQGYSDESKQTLSKFYDENYEDGRLRILFDAKENDDLIALMTSHCSMCRTALADIQEHFEYAACKNDQLVFYTHPTLVCGGCTLRIYTSLSEETRDHKRRFTEKYFGFPPFDRAQISPIDKTFRGWDFP